LWPIQVYYFTYTYSYFFLFNDLQVKTEAVVNKELKNYMLILDGVTVENGLALHIKVYLY